MNSYLVGMWPGMAFRAVQILSVAAARAGWQALVARYKDANDVRIVGMLLIFLPTL
jgi:hypothetical protein